LGGGNKGSELAVGKKLKREAGNWPLKQQLLTFLSRTKSLSPGEKGIKRVGVVYFNCWGLKGWDKGSALAAWTKIEKGGQKLVAKATTTHLFAQN